MINTSEEVAEALHEGRPVVALESTIIAHGLPRPRNLEVAVELEQLLRKKDVTPATIGVIDGVPTAGLTTPQLEIMATSDEVEFDGVVKAGVRDLAVMAVHRRHAATTVASTAFLAAKAGIEVFATGGLGGVHRGGGYDESNDLVTLARTRLAVVCAGVKSILDVPATLERLETLGITVVGYRTDRFPGFYVADSGHPLDHRADTPGQIARILGFQRDMEIGAAVIVANPVSPGEQLDPAVHDETLRRALAAAEEAGLQGKAVTPFLLDHIREVTGGASLAANVAAVRGNVEVAADIARALR